MNEITKKNKHINLSSECILKIILAIHYLINLTCHLNGFYYLVIPSAIIMFYEIIKRLPKFIKQRKIDLFYLGLVLFCVSYLLTFAINPKYEIIGTLKIFIWTIIDFFFVFYCDAKKTKEQLTKEMSLVLKIIIVIVTIINIYGLSLLITNTNKYVNSFDGKVEIIGVTSWGRFVGDYYDTNYATIVCSCAILFAMYFFKQSKRVTHKILYITSFVIQLITIYYSQSRTGLITLSVGIILYFILSIKSNKNMSFNKLILLLSCLIVIGSSIFILPKYILKIYNSTTNTTQIGRTDIGENKDLSNRRFDIWKSGFEIFCYNPVFGLGFPNIEKNALENFPTTYIVNNDLANFAAFHNMLIDICVSQGIFGICIVIYLVCVFIKKLKKFNKEEKVQNMLLSCIGAILVSSMVVSEIFFINNACTFLFWLLLGYENYYLSNKKEERL